MTPKAYFSIFGVVSGLFGIGFVLAPAQVLMIYGIESSPAVELAARLCGGTLLAVAIILWSARDFRDQAAVRAVLVASVLSDAVNFVVVLLAVVSGTINGFGWSTVLIFLCGALGAGYLLAASKAQQQAA
jgi:hypothetical protein